MELSLLILNILIKDKNRKLLSSIKIYGCNNYLNHRHNFNGTSKGMGETLARPCPAPSQMLLNQKRR